MTLPTTGVLRGTSADAYQQVLTSIAPNASRLKESYHANLARGLGAAALLHVIALGAYWLVAGTAAVPEVIGAGLKIGPPITFEPPISPTPPAPPSGPSVSPPAAGVVTPVEDDRADPDATAPTQDDLSGPDAREGDTGSAGDGRMGDGPPAVPEPYRPRIDTTPPAVPRRAEPDTARRFDVPTEPLAFAEVQPELIGGLPGLRIVYPAFERQAGIEGRVVVQFVVGADGTPTDVVVARGASPGLDRAATEAVQRARFTPGRQNGRAVPVRFTLPVNFVLN